MITRYSSGLVFGVCRRSDRGVDQQDSRLQPEPDVIQEILFPLEGVTKFFGHAKAGGPKPVASFI
jgi:hypothetical protein